jgi:hypothetical protein
MKMVELKNKLISDFGREAIPIARQAGRQLAVIALSLFSSLLT